MPKSIDILNSLDEGRTPPPGYQRSREEIVGLVTKHKDKFGGLLKWPLEFDNKGYWPAHYDKLNGWHPAHISVVGGEGGVYGLAIGTTEDPFIKDYEDFNLGMDLGENIKLEGNLVCAVWCV